MKVKRLGGWLARLPYSEAMEVLDALRGLETNTRAEWQPGATIAERARKRYPLCYMRLSHGHLARLRRLRWVRLSATGKSVTLTPRGARAIERLFRLRVIAEAAGDAAHAAAAATAWAALTQQESLP